MTNDPAIMHDQPVTGNDPQRADHRCPLNSCRHGNVVHHHAKSGDVRCLVGDCDCGAAEIPEPDAVELARKVVAGVACGEVVLAREVLRLHEPDAALVERVARAIALEVGLSDPDDIDLDVARDVARAALAALTGDSA